MFILTRNSPKETSIEVWIYPKKFNTYDRVMTQVKESIVRISSIDTSNGLRIIGEIPVGGEQKLSSSAA